MLITDMLMTDISLAAEPRVARHAREPAQQHGLQAHRRRSLGREGRRLQDDEAQDCVRHREGPGNNN